MTDWKRASEPPAEAGGSGTPLVGQVPHPDDHGVVPVLEHRHQVVIEVARPCRGSQPLSAASISPQSSRSTGGMNGRPSAA